MARRGYPPEFALGNEGGAVATGESDALRLKRGERVPRGVQPERPHALPRSEDPWRRLRPAEREALGSPACQPIEEIRGRARGDGDEATAPALRRDQVTLREATADQILESVALSCKAISGSEAIGRCPLAEYEAERDPWTPERRVPGRPGSGRYRVPTRPARGPGACDSADRRNDRAALHSFVQP